MTHTVWFAVLAGVVLGSLGALVGANQGAVVGTNQSTLGAAGLAAFGATVGILTIGTQSWPMH